MREKLSLCVHASTFPFDGAECIKFSSTLHDVLFLSQVAEGR